MRSPVASVEQLQKDSSRSNVGTSFSMPSTVTSTGGSVVHIRPLPSTRHHHVPFADAEGAPLTPIFA